MWPSPGVEVGDWVDPTGETRDVSVRLHPDDRVDAGNIERLPIAVSGSNRMVPLEQIATVTMGRGPSQIQHSDGKRSISVAANAQGRSPGEVTADAMKLARFDELPARLRPANWPAPRATSRRCSSRWASRWSAASMLMYLVLVMQFGSFTAPLAVMVSLPLSLIGVVLALLLTGGTLNLMSFIGVIMLMGLVAKNAILLLDAARVREAEGMDREEALMAAGRKRLRPILMTTFALIAGMLPVAIGVGEGGEFYRPMAVAIIGGTITSTLLTLLVIPSFYDSIEVSRDRMVAKFKQRAERWNPLFAFVVTGVEALLTLVLRAVGVSPAEARPAVGWGAARWAAERAGGDGGGGRLSRLEQWPKGGFAVRCGSAAAGVHHHDGAGWLALSAAVSNCGTALAMPSVSTTITAANSSGSVGRRKAAADRRRRGRLTRCGWGSKGHVRPCANLEACA